MEISTRDNIKIFLGSRGTPVREADNLVAIIEPIAEKMWDP
jgi:hypothetical protein